MFLALFLAGSGLGAVLAQERQVPEFRADVRLIRLDVSVVDRHGRPVPGLGPGDFAVTEDGRPVDVTYFEAVAPDSVDSAPALGPASQRPLRRRVLLLVDTGRMTRAQLQRARDGAAQFIRRETGDGDWLRLVNLSTGRAWDGAIPGDRRGLEAAARRLDRLPSPSLAGETIADAIDERVEDEGVDAPSSTETSGRFLSVFAQTSGLMGSLESILVQLGGVPGRKALVLVSPGFPQLRDLDRRLETVATLAREAAATIYFVDAAGLDGLLPEPGGRMRPAFELAWQRGGGAQDLAAATGGFTSRFSNSLDSALARVGGEMRTYYVLGYVPARPDDGRFRSVRVKVARSGLVARTKKGYLAGRRR